jgi:positive regulator of sigma E activity
VTEPNFRWHNLCIGIKISVNSGAALLLYVAAFFLLFHWAGLSNRAASLYPVAIGTLTGAFGGFLVKRHSDKRTGANIEIEKMKISGKE